MYCYSYVTSAQKRTCGPLEHAQPLYFYLPGMWGIKDVYTAVKTYDSRLLCQMCGLQTCMLPKGLIWEGVAPPHIGVTQYSKKGLSQKYLSR